MTAYTYDEDIYSDLYKEAYGVRPGENVYNWWFSLNPENKQVEWDYLVKQMRQRREEELEFQKESIRVFELRIDECVAAGARDRDTAIRWMVEAEGNEDVFEDMDYFCYMNGLPYGYFKGDAK